MPCIDPSFSSKYKYITTFSENTSYGPSPQIQGMVSIGGTIENMLRGAQFMIAGMGESLLL